MALSEPILLASIRLNGGFIETRPIEMQRAIGRT
jgi:hypothetical protein